MLNCSGASREQGEVLSRPSDTRLAAHTRSIDPPTPAACGSLTVSDASLHHFAHIRSRTCSAPSLHPMDNGQLPYSGIEPAADILYPGLPRSDQQARSRRGLAPWSVSSRERGLFQPQTTPHVSHHEFTGGTFNCHLRAEIGDAGHENGVISVLHNGQTSRGRFRIAPAVGYMRLLFVFHFPSYPVKTFRQAQRGHGAAARRPGRSPLVSSPGGGECARRKEPNHLPFICTESLSRRCCCQPLKTPAPHPHLHPLTGPRSSRR